MFDFTALLPYVGQLVMIAVIVEALTEGVKRVLPDNIKTKMDSDTKQVIAIVISAVLFTCVPLNIFDNIVADVLANLIAIFTVSRGSNCVHDLAKLINEAAGNVGKQ